MSLQICPNCKRKSITWSIDEEESPYTLWRCDNCGYEMYEDETKEAACLTCGANSGCMLVKDARGFHRWCCGCNLFELTDEGFVIEEE